MCGLPLTASIVRLYCRLSVSPPSRKVPCSRSVKAGDSGQASDETDDCDGR